MLISLNFTGAHISSFVDVVSTPFFILIIIDCADPIIAWHIVFDSLWKDFGTRFNGILDSLARHRDLVDKEAMSIEILDARSLRIQEQHRLEQREKDRRVSQLQDSIAWLAVEDRILEDDLYRLSQRRQPGTCDWVLGISKLISWVADDDEEPILWLKGIPGAGRHPSETSVLRRKL